MNKYELCAQEIDLLFLSKGFNPYQYGHAGAHFCLPSTFKDAIYFYPHAFKLNKTFTESFLCSHKAVKFIFEVIEPVLKKWDIEDDKFLFSNYETHYYDVEHLESFKRKKIL